MLKILEWIGTYIPFTCKLYLMALNLSFDGYITCTGPPLFLCLHFVCYREPEVDLPYFGLHYNKGHQNQSLAFDFPIIHIWDYICKVSGVSHGYGPLNVTLSMTLSDGQKPHISTVSAPLMNFPLLDKFGLSECNYHI